MTDGGFCLDILSKRIHTRNEWGRRKITLETSGEVNVRFALGNIPKKTSDDQLETILKEFGELEHFKMIRTASGGKTCINIF